MRYKERKSGWRTHLDPLVVRALPRLLFQRARHVLHFRRGPPRPTDDLANPPHRLRVGRDDRDGARVVQDVFGRDRLGADARLGKGDVFGCRERRARGQKSAASETRGRGNERIERSRWWHTMSICGSHRHLVLSKSATQRRERPTSRCSSRVFVANGRVGFVDDGITLLEEIISRQFGAWPPL